MGHALEPEDRFERLFHHETGLGLGRVGLASGAGSPLAWSADGVRCLVLEGELYDTARLERSLEADPQQTPPASHADLLLRVYERWGSAGFARVNGAFAAALWDRTERRLSIVNDRLGLLPVYFAQVRGGLLFASGVRGILADPAVDRTVDAVAVQEFLLYDHVLGDRTLVESVRLLPQASVLAFQDGRRCIRPYWTLRYPEVYDPQPEEAYVEGFMHHMRQAVERQTPDDRPAAVMLSGGLDSRVILALLCAGGHPVETLTFGIPGCDDARVARELARAAGCPHRFFELEADWLERQASDAVRTTDGLGNVVNLHAFATAEAQSRHAQVVYKGFLGDALFGFALKRQMWGDYEPEVRYGVHQAVHRSQGVLNYDQVELRALLTGAFRARAGDGAYDAYKDGMDRASSRQLANERLYFDLTQRVPRMTLNGVEAARSHMVVRLPFADNDLVQFALTVPPGFLFERYLPRTAFARAFPRFAKIPIAGSGRPMIACARDLAVQARELLSWHLRHVGLSHIAAQRRRPYKDYNAWFRGVLRPWVEGLLLAPRTLDRGYFEAETVRRLVSAHMAGENHAVRIGALLTLELWHRQFTD